MTVGERLDLAVERLVFRGLGLARHAGEVVFVAGVAPGERVRARVTRLHRRFAEAELLEVLVPSPNRIVPCCRLDNGQLTPGCVYDHLAYPAEVAAKQAQLEEFLRPLPGDANRAILPPCASPRASHYRNKIVLHAARAPGEQRPRLGYVGDDNRSVVDLPACPLAREPINAALAELRAADAARLPRDGQRLTLRWTAADGGVVCWRDGAPRHAPLTEMTPFGRVATPLDGFYQVNPEVADALVRQVVAWCAADGGGRPLLDLYCGVGVFALAGAKAGLTPVAGVESGRAAVDAARANAIAHRVAARFFCRTVAQAAAANFDGFDLRAATVIVDPPRQGLEPEATAALAARKPPRLCYVSCDPATLARDLRLLLASAYQLRRARLFDMFPRTACFETAVWLTLDG
jgi:tRNA/tmRNA/rRNA uracil-C5-methylase (TrmA/RlmC/RlmD family)